MNKIGIANGKVLVTLSNAEFTGLSGQVSSNVPDNTDISLGPIQAKIALVDAKEAELLDLKTTCQDVVDKLNLIGI